MTMESTVATITKGDVTVTETVTAPVFVDGVAMLPLRDAANFTGGTVKYDASGYVIVSAGDDADENIRTYIEAYNK